VLAERIATRLGDAVVAPVLAYVPEGGIEPPSQHMRWPGTISIPEPAFEALLGAAARSFRRHGLCHVVLLGDHGGYRASLDRVAATVNKDWARSSGCRVHALPEYYRAAQADFAASLKARGFTADEIGTHAGLADTALALAAAPRLVRMEAAAMRPTSAANDGVAGDPRRATAELGEAGLEHIVDVTVTAIRKATRAAP
jgi:creatinine amidohydrolase